MNNHIEYISTERMSVDEWISMRDNPRQRNTEIHARSASHLRSLHPTHAMVAAAVLPDGTRVKIDGHTRAYLWKLGELPRPEHVDVQCWKVADMEAAKELYSTFDSSVSVETGIDRYYGALREIGFAPRSKFLKAARSGSALLRAAETIGLGTLRGKPDGIYIATRTFREVIAAFDALDPKPIDWPVGVIMAFLITMRGFPNDAREFWELYASDGGVSTSDKHSAVEHLRKYVQDKRAQGISGGPIQIEMMRRAIGCFYGFTKHHNAPVYTKRNGPRAEGDVIDGIIENAARKTRAGRQ